MEAKEYLAYIASFVVNNSYYSNPEVRDYIKLKLGSFTTTDAEKAKKLARHLYRAHIVHLYTRYGAFHLAKNLTDVQLAELLEEQISLDKKYKLHYEIVDREIKKLSHIDKIIRDQGEPKFKSVLTALSKVPGKKNTVSSSVPTKKLNGSLSSEDYLKYIADFIKAEHGSKTNLRGLFKVPPLKAKSIDMKSTARHFYRAYVVGAYTRFNVMSLLGLSDEKLLKLLSEQIALDKKYKIFIDGGKVNSFYNGKISSSIKTDEQVDAGISSMLKNAPVKYKAILETMDVALSPTRIKADAAAKRTKRAAPKKPAVKKLPAEKQILESLSHGQKTVRELLKLPEFANYDKSTLNKEIYALEKKNLVKKATRGESAAPKWSIKIASPKKAKTAKSSVKSTTVKKTKSTKTTKIAASKTMTVPELKEAAKAAGIKGYSKMRKDELIAALK